MPKEITHWLIARRVAKAARGSRAGQAALGHPHALMLGAVFPDVLYFLVGFPGSARYRNFARACHGTDGEDTYDLARHVATALPESPFADPLWAFLTGLACHVCTDQTFHPLVYGWTGDTEDRDPQQRSSAVSAHRHLECLVDLHFCGEKGLEDHDLGRILHALEMPLPRLLEIISQNEAFARTYPGLVPATLRALRLYVILQTLCRKRRLAGILDTLAPFLPRSFQETAALFYSPARDAGLSRLSGTLTYRHPLSGKTEETTLTTLFDLSVERSRNLIGRIEDAMLSGRPILPERGASLSYGSDGNPP